ncbi:hypothetical protein [Enterobacter hormaechei]|uniref:hypothetical protein n=1 Tax=Enterobacter hormaechei TaxID=158836 RepID=UPI0003828C86|nr:hypothetical protein [Enterobacter hormaechei]
MNWKILLTISLSIFMFTIGFFIGGIRWEWMTPGHNDSVAFWSMLGGWISGLATLAAVVISLLVAYHASQNAIEKLNVRVGKLSKNMDESYSRADITVQNLKGIRAEIIDIRLIVDKKLDSIPFTIALTSERALPNVLDKIGETAVYSIRLSTATTLWGVYDAIYKQGGVKFGHTKIQVITTMGQYTCLLPRDLIAEFKVKLDRYAELMVPSDRMA